MDARRKRDLEARGVYCGIIRRRVRGQKQLPEYQRLINRLLSMTRAIVEHPFAWMSQMGHDRARYRGLRRNAFDFALMSVAYNIKRSLRDRKSTRLNSSHVKTSYAVFCLKKKKVI